MSSRKFQHFPNHRITKIVHLILRLTNSHSSFHKLSSRNTRGRFDHGSDNCLNSFGREMALVRKSGEEDVAPKLQTMSTYGIYDEIVWKKVITTTFPSDPPFSDSTSALMTKPMTASSRILHLIIYWCITPILNASSARWEYPPWCAFGRREETKRARSVSCTIDETKAMRGRCLAADLKGRRKEKRDWGLRECYGVC